MVMTDECIHNEGDNIMNLQFNNPDVSGINFKFTSHNLHSLVNLFHVFKINIYMYL